MKILFDLSQNTTIYSGLTIYAINVLLGFRDNQYDNIKILCNREIYDYVHKMFPDYECFLFENPKTKLFFYISGIRWYNLLKKIDCDIIFSPYPCVCYFFMPKKIVQTIHDLQFLRVFRGKLLWKYRILFPLILLRSCKIIVISEYVKNELHRIYPFISLDKICIIPNAVVVNPTPLPPPSNISTRYILYVSALWKYKNVLTLIKAFALLKNQISQHLVILGREMDSSWRLEALPFIVEHKLEDRIIHITRAVSSEELMQLYQHADLFVHPSLLEGFGFTPIEAAIQKTPVLTTKETSLYESTLGILNYYEPSTSAEALADKIISLLESRPDISKLEWISETFQNEYNYKKQAEKVYKYIWRTYNTR